MMVSLLRALVAHDQDDNCVGHCWWHEVDEVGDGYIRCGECGHLYLTKRDLVRMYRSKSWEMFRSRPFRWRGVPGFEPSGLAELWGILTTRAKDIDFCQLCIHDF